MPGRNKEPIRADGPTPSGGAYSILYFDGDRPREVVEYDADGRSIMRTTFAAALTEDPPEEDFPSPASPPGGRDRYAKHREPDETEYEDD
jgi:hypothetical protein